MMKLTAFSRYADAVIEIMTEAKRQMSGTRTSFHIQMLF